MRKIAPVSADVSANEYKMCVRGAGLMSVGSGRHSENQPYAVHKRLYSRKLAPYIPLHDGKLRDTRGIKKRLKLTSSLLLALDQLVHAGESLVLSNKNWTGTPLISSPSSMPLASGLDASEVLSAGMDVSSLVLGPARLAARKVPSTSSGCHAI